MVCDGNDENMASGVISTVSFFFFFYFIHEVSTSKIRSCVTTAEVGVLQARTFY